MNACRSIAWVLTWQEPAGRGVDGLTGCSEEAVFHGSGIFVFTRVPELDPPPPFVIRNLDGLSIVLNEQKSGSTSTPQGRGEAHLLRLESHWNLGFASSKTR